MIFTCTTKERTVKIKANTFGKICSLPRGQKLRRWAPPRVALHLLLGPGGQLADAEPVVALAVGLVRGVRVEQGLGRGRGAELLVGDVGGGGDGGRRGGQTVEHGRGHLRGEAPHEDAAVA